MITDLQLMYTSPKNNEAIFVFKSLSISFNKGPGPVRSLSATPIAINGVPALHLRWSPPVDKAGGGLTYRLRVVPPHVTMSRPTRATLYNVPGLRANTRYTVYVRAVSSGVYGPEESDVGTTGGSECRIFS